jgi:hypothetical protein
MINVPLFTRFKQSCLTALPLKMMKLRQSNTPRTYPPTIWLHVSQGCDPQQQSLEKSKTSQLSLECIYQRFVETHRTICMADFFHAPPSQGIVWNVRWCEEYLCRLRDGVEEHILQNTFGNTTTILLLGRTTMTLFSNSENARWRNKRWCFLQLVTERVPLKVLYRRLMT